MSPYTTLGIRSNADLATAEKAYRKLAMKHHPDRGGNEETFKAVKAAWESIESGFRDEVSTPPPRNRQQPQWDKPRSPGNTWRDTSDDIGNIFEDLKRANRSAPNGDSFGATWAPHSVEELVGNVSLREAFSGYSMIIPKHHRNGTVTNSTVHIPPGMPAGYRQKYQTSDGSLATVVTRIVTGDYSLRGFDDQNNLFSAGLKIGDIELDYEIHAIDIVLGGWITTKDFLGENLSVRVPPGFNPLHRLKIAGKGYYGWDQLASAPTRQRQDMYLRLKPLFTKIEDLEKEKILSLYRAVQAMAPKDES